MSDQSPQTPAIPSAKDFLQSQALPRYQALRSEVQARLAQAQKELEDLDGAAASFCWHVEGEPPVYLNFAGGEVAVAAEPAHAPVMSVRMSGDDWRRFASGQVGGGFLDGGGNRGGFGRSRVERLRPLKGTVRFTLTGADGGDWSVDLGLNGAAAEPTATISMPVDVAAEIQSGKLNPQMAFMQGKVKMAGDAGLVMQFGMAMFV